ncbi:unnamed protein product [Dibothriocephalus latus]|uniref:Uncharacterized protein n=1 Tax=Dibothriocephalus latus TaxID=60516 RepID=A0A3P7N7Z4_DIBLA|nr:unnamed protein product [Dibothriocephalus latus]
MIQQHPLSHLQGLQIYLKSCLSRNLVHLDAMGEAFSSVSALIENAMNFSKKGAYCLSRPTDSVKYSPEEPKPVPHEDSEKSEDAGDGASDLPSDTNKVRLLFPLSRHQLSPTLQFLCRFAIQKYIRSGVLEPTRLLDT